MSKLKSLILALLVLFTSMFSACDDEEKTEEEVQAGEVVECVVTEDVPETEPTIASEVVGPLLPAAKASGVTSVALVTL